MRGLSRRTFAGMLAAAPGSALPAPRAPAIIGPPWAPPAWQGRRQLGAGGRTISAPGAVYDGLLYLVVRGLDSGIYYSVTNAGFENTWSPWREIPGGGRTPSGPAVAAWTGYPDGIDSVVLVRDESNGIQFNPYNDEQDTWW